MSSLDPPQIACGPPAAEGNDPAERLTACMRQLHRLISDRIMGSLQSELQGEDVSFTQMTALYKVRAFAPISLTALAEHLGVSLPATSQLIQELVGRKLMERRENPQDRREKLLALSEKGQQFLSVKEKTMIGAYSELFRRAHPETLGHAETAINALLDEIRQSSSHAPPLSKERL
ncbi:MarR family winged helix-turn-helix transcriptional regulator [Deinococcus arenicola]|uniref:MarR family transcriptional regulator n=1 Tax=Deinococcus arenicola TaxID=2994950 RepID=A0ABU4DLZ2_9DEIO|nr:MarR family transcriptional regulator [Deinococcus sp. ZS9-10]MDV6373455.1 MarR family transcriptional regulator [Deinococcus sp. ZS9-10]